MEPQQMENVKKEDLKEDKFEILLSTLELRLPLQSCRLRHEEEDEEDRERGGDLVKTPRSLEPMAVLECPPPPRKPRRFPPAKRKADGRSILMPRDYDLLGELELELELLFPSNLLGGKPVKKVKRSVE